MRLTPLLAVCACLCAIGARPIVQVHMGEPGRVTELSGRHIWRQLITLDGPVALAAGSELVIEPGARIEAAPGAWLSVGRNARVRAVGTALEPIVFTCNSLPLYEGCWEGLSIRGNARVNFGALTSPPPRGVGTGGCRETLSGDFAFGGCDDGDSSGVLSFVRVEHANSGLQLLGTGSGTLIDFVQVNRSRRDGLRIVGGAVNLRHLFLTASREYGLTWLGGWRGRGQFIAIQQDAAWNRGGVLASNAADNDSSNFQGNPRSAPVLHNLTVVAPSLPSNPSLALSPAGIVFARGTSGTLRNVLVYRAPVGFAIADAATCIPFSIEPPVLTNVLVAGAGSAGDPDPDPTCLGYASPTVESEWLADPGNASRVVTDANTVQQLLVGAENLITPDTRPRPGTDAVTLPSAPAPADAFFMSAPYIGAVAPANLSATNIPWHAGWTVPAPLPPSPGTVMGVVASVVRGPFPGATIASNVGTLTSAGPGGSYTLVLPAGMHRLTAGGLPYGCASTPVQTSVPVGGSVTTNVNIDCTVISQVAAGTTHACATSALATVQCWGDNSSAALANGTVQPPFSAVPVLVATPYAITQLTSGYSHTCGLASGTALCWGLNAFAALGIGSIGGLQATPLPPSTGGVPFVKIAAGGYHTCAITAAGEAWCWGWNAEGQTGIGSAGSPVILPQRVQDGGVRFTDIAAGESHTCALTTAGEAWCWGGNARGELGSDPSVVGAIVPTPLRVPGGVTFSSIDGGLTHTCALSTVGAAWCWGDRTAGQVGDGVTGTTIAPPSLAGAGRVYVQISVGGETSCAVESGVLQVWCWGRGDQGSLGNGTTSGAQPISVAATLLSAPGPQVASPRVDVGPASGPQGSLVCAINTLGEVSCWGPGQLGQRGDGSTTAIVSVPRQVRLVPP